jgi:superfamily II DNA or RNA helicase
MVNVEGMRRLLRLLESAEDALRGGGIEQAREHLELVRADTDLLQGNLPEGLKSHIGHRLEDIDTRLSAGRLRGHDEFKALASALSVVLPRQHDKSLLLEADRVGVRMILEGRGAGHHLWVLSRHELRAAAFRCDCHGTARVIQSSRHQAEIVETFRVVSRCSTAIISVVCDVLLQAGLNAEDMGRKLRVSGTRSSELARATGIAVGEAWPPVDWDLHAATVMCRQRSQLEALDGMMPGQDRVSRSGRSVPPLLARWRGFPLPHVCRAQERAILERVDEAGAAAAAELIAWAGATACTVHGSGDVAQLLGDRTKLRPVDGGLRLTLDGQFRSDALHRSTSPFVITSAGVDAPSMYQWQEEALQAWADHGRVGVVEAVTGTGKTRIGVEAIREALRDGFKAVVCVPTLVLRDQWIAVLSHHGFRRIGALGGGSMATLVGSDVLVSTVQTLRVRENLLRHVGRAMLVVDECHRAGAATFQDALDSAYERRLGLTATFERADRNIEDLKAFFEGDPVFQIGYERAVPEGIVAEYRVARVGVEFTTEERLAYDEANAACSSHRAVLINAGVPSEPFGEYMNAVAALAADPADPLAASAKAYLEAFSRRAQILSLASGKVDALRQLCPAIKTAQGVLVFTMRRISAATAAEVLRSEGVRAVSIDGESPAEQRNAALDGLRARTLDAVVAPRILDEGVDVPDVDLGVIVATSKSRIQMIQRMGRVLRLKPDGRRARFVLLYVRDTAEDPDGPGAAHEAFFDAITPTADAVRSFHVARLEELTDFLAG